MLLARATQWACVFVGGVHRLVATTALCRWRLKPHEPCDAHCHAQHAEHTHEYVHGDVLQPFQAATACAASCSNCSGPGGRAPTQRRTCGSRGRGRTPSRPSGPRATPKTPCGAGENKSHRQRRGRRPKWQCRIRARCRVRPTASPCVAAGDAKDGGAQRASKLVCPPRTWHNGSSGARWDGGHTTPSQPRRRAGVPTTERG